MHDSNVCISMYLNIFFSLQVKIKLYDEATLCDLFSSPYGHEQFQLIVIMTVTRWHLGVCIFYWILWLLVLTFKELTFFTIGTFCLTDTLCHAQQSREVFGMYLFQWSGPSMATMTLFLSKASALPEGADHILVDFLALLQQRHVQYVL